MGGMRKRSEAQAKIEEASEELAEEMSANDKPVPLFDNPHAPREAALSPGFDRIVEKVFVKDPDAAYARLERDLRIGDERATYGALVKALDEAETNARLAHRLYVSARVERERWELDNEVFFAGMRVEAMREIQREKDMKMRSKQITDADVASMCASMYPDQYRAQEVQRRKVKVMEESLANLSEVWLIRCKSLQTLLSRQR